MVAAAKLPATRMNGATSTPPAAPPPLPPASAPELFAPDTLRMLRLMRFNPLPLLNPETLGQWLDQFEAGMLRSASLLWEAMCKRDDTLTTVKPQLENAIASKQWGVFTIEGADEAEAARHKACLEYFYDHMRAVDAFDRNERGGRDKFIEQMMRAESFTYAVHHIVWKPVPGKTVPVEGAEPVPVITAELEYVPLWFFENTTGRLRFLPDGGFGINGKELDWEGEWMCTTGRGLMFAASICYVFKRLTFQDWTIFNERYAQNKVIIQTPAGKTDPAGVAARTVAENFNSDQAFVFYGSQQPGDKPPISLLGPQGTATADIFEKFIERQDRKMSSMYRGNDLSMMSRAGKGEKPTGASLQGDEGDDMEKGAARRIAGTVQESLDRQVIRLCFGEGVEPLAYFGLPDMDVVDTDDLRKSAGFLADRGAQVKTSEIADRLGIELSSATDPAKAEDVLQALKLPSNSGDTKGASRQVTMNAAQQQTDMEAFLGPYRDEFAKAFQNDLIPLRLAIEHVVTSPNDDMQTANVRALQSQLPWTLKHINARPRTAVVLADLLREAMRLGFEEAAKHRKAA